MAKTRARLFCPSCKADLADVGIWQKLDGKFSLSSTPGGSTEVQLDPLSSSITGDEPSCGSCDESLPLELFGDLGWRLRYTSEHAAGDDWLIESPKRADVQRPKR